MTKQNLEYLERRKRAREEAALRGSIERTKALGNKLLTDSGARGTNSPLVAFLYELMRDHVPVGVVQEILSRCPRESTRFTNGYLAAYAQWVARELRG